MMALATVAALLACGPAWAGGKKEGAGESGGGAVAPIASSATGVREKFIPPEQIGDSLGTLKLEATMMAGAGAGKCRMNFVLFNASTATVAMGMVGSSVSAKGEILDNWVVNIGALAPSGQTARLFSCGLGAVQLSFSPLSDFGTPPIKCVNAKQEAEACPVALQIKSSLPLIDKADIKPVAGGAAPAKGH
ncbi:hypothetical protein CU669_04125 [Paramagnetospirillum kuznetsovii]|uniref:Uncharacterized protein n=2 Tax=Paramagnetospirillum kuznetsovii TaxID=2053833 RepID=A0A364P1V9_9PROT|nr:hypothetical protein CU669_04125 [Paramagnetospirillum kuznetsovii]